MEGRGGGWWPEEEPDPPHEEEGEGKRPPSEPSGRPPRGLSSRDRPKVASRYSLFAGLVFVAIAVVAILNALGTDEGGILGPDDRGLPLAEFAVPDVAGSLTGDANIAQDDCETSENPCPEDRTRPPACEVQVEGALRVCDFFDRPLAISFWFTRGGDCLPTQNAFDRVARDYRGRVNFLSVNVLDDRERVEQIVAQGGWGVPVGHDEDGAVSNIYRVGVCPSILLAYPGGILHAAKVKPGNFGETEIEEMVEELLRASERRAGAVR